MKYWIDFGALALLYVRVLFRKWRSRGKDVLLVNTLMSVSYTHLTLPTILLV